VKCCSLCLEDHQFHDLVTISKATILLKNEILDFNFKKHFTNLKLNIDHLDKEITLKKKELIELEDKRKNESLILDSIQKISDSIKQEKEVDKILEWRSFLKSKENLDEYKIYACGKNNVGTLGLGDKIDKINKFTEISKFQNKKIDLIACGSFNSFIYSSISLELIDR
jgi:alpha-tubulin suppressor-like RCC1 family protein